MEDIRVGPCLECGSQLPQPLNEDGLCYWHQRHSRTAAKKGIVRHIGLSRTIQPVSAEDLDLQNFYRRHVSRMAGRCQECDAPIMVMNYKIAKSALAHILPKKIFHSVRTHDLNLLELGGACGCHDKWDKDWSSAADMKVFTVAAERFLLFYPSIAQEERGDIPECFRKLIV